MRSCRRGIHYAETIDMGNNMFNGKVPFESFGLPSLKRLELSHNQLAGHIDVQTFRQLINLTHLDLSSNSFRIKAINQ